MDGVFLVRRRAAIDQVIAQTPRRRTGEAARRAQVERIRQIKPAAGLLQELDEWARQVSPSRFRPEAHRREAFAAAVAEQVAAPTAQAAAVQQVAAAASGGGRSAPAPRAAPITLRLGQPLRSRGRAPGKAESSLIGIVVVEMSSDDAAALAEDRPDLEVIPDRPLKLIEPDRTLATHKPQVATSDLWHLDSIALTAARKRGFSATGKGVNVAVLDTGIQPHAEFGQRLTGVGTLDRAAWTVRPAPTPYDTSGHGTHVAGLLCGQMVGVAPDAEVFGVIMIPNGIGTVSDFTLAMEWTALQPQFAIMNMSAGHVGFDPFMQAAVDWVMAAGVLPVIAIGNEGRSTSRSPGNYARPISVGASTKDRRVAGFSGGGTMLVDNISYVVPDCVAPGADVYSCVMGGGYEDWSGTSMATPVISGIAALIIEANPNIELDDLVDTILDRCVHLNLPAERQGNGLVQVG